MSVGGAGGTGGPSGNWTFSPLRTDATEPSDAPLAAAAPSRPSAAGAPSAAPSGAGRNAVMLNLTAAPGTVPPGDDSAPRVGTNIPIANPLADGAANSADYAAISTAMGFGLDKLAEKFPGIDKNVAARFLETAISTGAQVPLMVVSHEAGHYKDAAADGANPSIEMTGYASADTYWTDDPNHPLTSDQEMIIDAAGVNQEMRNASDMFEKMAANGGARYQVAMGYLLAQTNTALYALNSMRHSLQGNVRADDDIQAYIDRLNAKGDPMTKGQLTAIATATDVLSAPVWAALIGQVRFLVNGSRDVAMPTIKVGDVTATLPNFQTLLTSNGPVVGGQVMIDPDKKIPVEVSAYARIDKQAAAAVGLKLFDIPLGTDKVTVSPFVRGTYDERTGLGIAAGAEVDANIYKDVKLTASVEYQKNDLLSEPEGTPEGFSGNVGISIPF
jgi:hypothetical protein